MKAVLLVAPLVLLAACHRGGADLHNVVQTRAPGHIAAGGHTSGEVIAASPQPQASANMPSGTPGIPQGAEGNTGGTALGGAQAQPGAGQQAPAPPMEVRSEKSGTAPASEDVKTGEQKSPNSLQPSAPNKAGH